MSNKAVNINAISASTLTASTLSQVAYMSPAQLAAYTPPAGFSRLVTLEGKFTATSLGFSAITFVNKETGQVVIAYRGSDTNGEKLMAAYSASTGTWDPQFTDATNYAKQARAAALDQINDYRADQGKPLLTVKDINPLVTGHSLGGLLGQVVSKMFGWRAEVFDSLGGGRLVTTQAFYDQAKVLGQVDADGKVIDYKVSDKIINYATSLASDIGIQLGKTEDIPALGQVSKNKARKALNVIGKLAVICLLGTGFYGAQADDKPSKYFFSEAQAYQMPRWVCQFGEGDGGFPEGMAVPADFASSD